MKPWKTELTGRKKIEKAEGIFRVETFSLESFPHSTGNFQGIMILESEDTRALHQWFSLHQEAWLAGKG